MRVWGGGGGETLGANPSSDILSLCPPANPGPWLVQHHLLANCVDCIKGVVQHSLLAPAGGLQAVQGAQVTVLAADFQLYLHQQLQRLPEAWVPNSRRLWVQPQRLRLQDTGEISTGNRPSL